MKQIISIILCTVLLLSLGGCNSTSTPQDTTAPVTHNTTEPSPEPILGAFDGRRYENAYVGIGAKLPEAWEYYSDTQLKKLNGCSENMPEDEYIKKVNDAPAVIDMYAFHKNGTDTIEVTIEKISQQSIPSFKLDEYYDKYKEAYEIYYTDLGYKDIAFTTVDVFFGGNETTALRMTAKDVLDTDVYQIFVADLVGSYCYCVSLVSFEEDQTGIVSDFFYTIEE